MALLVVEHAKYGVETMADLARNRVSMDNHVLKMRIHTSSRGTYFLPYHSNSAKNSIYTNAATHFPSLASQLFANRSIFIQDIPVKVANCAYLTPFCHLGACCASTTLRLYFFSKRSCCCGVRSPRFGGHTLRALNGVLAAVVVVLEPRIEDVTLLRGSRERRRSVGNMFATREVGIVLLMIRVALCHGSYDIELRNRGPKQPHVASVFLNATHYCLLTLHSQ